MSFEKRLPGGIWLYLNNQVPNLTDVQMQEFLRERGVDLPLENISVRHYASASAAKISVPNDVVQDLVNWAINGEKLHGQPVEARIVAKS